MKKFTLLLIFAALISCSNDDNDLSSKNNLKGKWNWIITTGGITGGSQTPETTKQTKVIEFSGNTLKTYINGTLSETQKFSIKTRQSPDGGSRKVIVINPGDAYTNQVYIIDRYFEIIGKKLYLTDECADCYRSEYERIK
ncbi:hypothetical protein [Flavobacterium hydrophilum]|uniref:Lipocalin-like domain-containing protein n=1 Tax=Flavobacterium hydrophilum TaxID=2211445 RepID=A0A2V4C431_9FLAO|nr:hypothetical protein [Flavobacterium hydrophilum]PXY46101.1 hypothetical protein DMB68_02620 [Flavobacterium hydrophilum]